MLDNPKIPLFAGVAGALIHTLVAFLSFFCTLFSIYPGAFFYGFLNFLSLVGWVLILAFFGLRLFQRFKK